MLETLDTSERIIPPEPSPESFQ